MIGGCRYDFGCFAFSLPYESHYTQIAFLGKEKSLTTVLVARDSLDYSSSLSPPESELAAASIFITAATADLKGSS